jgi:hypothetical protein
VVSWRALVASVLLPATASAAEPRFSLPPLVPELRVELQAIPAGEDQIVVLEEGKPAPFSGQLFSNNTALRWGNWLEQYRIQTPLMLETQRAVCVAELQYRDSLLVVHQEASDSIRGDLQARLKSVEQRNAELQAELSAGPGFFRSRDFGVILGVVGAAGLTMLSIWAVDATTQ